MSTVADWVYALLIGALMFLLGTMAWSLIAQCEEPASWECRKEVVYISGEVLFVPVAGANEENVAGWRRFGERAFCGYGLEVVPVGSDLRDVELTAPNGRSK
ncbi:hypothetical protein CMI37_03510 [Candidatus Pacearchaeota archaeon]|nr:hypothetical protein [Candidatus Pacearchaeota archaeon]